jgi:nucleolar protein 4
MTHTKQNVSSTSSIYSKTTLFVRRVPYDATNSEFEAFFSKIGPLRSCFLVKDKESDNNLIINNSINDNDSIGRSSSSNPNGEIIHPVKDTEKYLQKDEKNKGFGFVQFVLAQDAEKSLNELKKVKFRGKSTLKMEYAIKKYEKPSEPIQKVIKRKFSLQDNDNEKVLKMEFMKKHDEKD